MIAQRPLDRAVPPTHVMGVARFERFFRAAAGLDVDKADLKRFSDFVNHRVCDLPDIAGGLGVALARAFKIIDPDLKNPQTMHWQRSFEIFDLLPYSRALL